MRKTALVVIPLLLVLSFACSYHSVFIDFNPLISMIAYSLWAIFMLFCIGSMFVLGTFRNTKWAIGAYFGFAAVIVGSAFKIQHWPGGKMLVTLGLILMALFYLRHFIVKKSKRLLDWLKIIYVVIAAVCISLPYDEPVRWTVFAAAMVLITAFYINLLKPTPKAVPVISDEDQEVFRYVD